MHWIALPDYAPSIFAAFDSSDVIWKKRPNFGCAVTRDESYLADFPRRIESSKESEKVGRRCCWTDFDANRISDAAKVLNVSTIDLSRPITDPEEVCRRVVESFSTCCCAFAMRRITFTSSTRRCRLLQQSSESLLVLEKQTFMAGEQVHGLKLTGCVGPDGAHEAQRICDGRDDGGVLCLQFRISNMSKTPVERSMKICDAGSQRCSNEVQGASRMEVCTGGCERMTRFAINDEDLLT